MKLELKLSPEQFEALELYIEAKVHEIVESRFGSDYYSYEERKAAYDILVEEDEV